MIAKRLLLLATALAKAIRTRLRQAVRATCRNASSTKWRLCSANLRSANLRSPVVILDPPAVGLTDSIRHALRVHPPTQLIYISCNPGTLARDLAAMGRIFRCESITPLDMFPQTAEIEVIVELTPRRSGTR